MINMNKISMTLWGGILIGIVISPIAHCSHRVEAQQRQDPQRLEPHGQDELVACIAGSVDAAGNFQPTKRQFSLTGIDGDWHPLPTSTPRSGSGYWTRQMEGEIQVAPKMWVP